MSEATKGREREYKVRDAMQGLGWETIFRSAGSKGAADIGMASPEHGLALVQIGKGTKSLGPGERARLLRAAWLCSAVPIVARVIATPGRPTVIDYWRVTDAPPSKWTRWEP